MIFNNGQLITIYKALRMNYSDGPDDKVHEEKLRGLISLISWYLLKNPGSLTEEEIQFLSSRMD